MPFKGFFAEIYMILCGRGPLTAQEIADIINYNGWYIKSTGRDVTATDVRNRIRNFDPDSSIIGMFGSWPKRYYIP